MPNPFNDAAAERSNKRVLAKAKAQADDPSRITQEAERRARVAAREEAPAEGAGDEPWGWNREVCTGCSASLTLEEIKSRGCVSCCPDRRMVKVRDLVDAYEAALASPPSERERELEGALEGLLNTSGARPSKGYHSLKYSEAVTRAENLLLTAQPAGEPTHG